jgi:hypothetical protein
VSQAFSRPASLDQGLGEDPYFYMTKLYIRFLQGVFNFLPSGHFHWEPDVEQTQIIIVGEAPLNQEVAGKRPIITVIMGPSSATGLGIDNMQTFDFKTGERRRTDLISGYMVAYCVAESDIVAMRLAHIVSHETRVHQRLLEGRGGFHQIARPAPSINQPSPPGALVQGDPKNLTMVQVNIPFHFQWTWVTTPTEQSPHLRNLGQVMGQDRAIDYPYASPVKLERVKLAISTTPVLVRRIGGANSSHPTTVEVGTEIRRFQLTDLLPRPPEEP